MSEKLISGSFMNGVVSKIGNKTSDDIKSKARFFEHEIINTAKSTPTNFVYSKIVKCDVTTPHSKDRFSALIKENSSKHIELKTRFPAAWDDFVSKGGSFGKKAEVKEEVKPSEVKEPQPENDIAPKIEELKEKYEKVQDKRSAEAREIKEAIKKLEE